VKFRKRPLVIDAFKWTRGLDQKKEPEWAAQGFKKNAREIGAMRIYDGLDNLTMEIRTLEGVVSAKEGDYIICGIDGEIYPCKPDIFEATYEPA